MSILAEFKTFALKGNVVDMAVGVIIGGAFGKIVNSLVTDVIMPPLGMLAGNMDFSDKRIVLKEAVTDAAGKAIPEVSIGYGLFINNLISFLIIAASIFLIVKLLNSAKRKEPTVAAPAEPPRQEVLLAEIRDLLKQR